MLPGTCWQIVVGERRRTSTYRNLSRREHLNRIRQKRRSIVASRRVDLKHRIIRAAMQMQWLNTYLVIKV